MTPCPPALTSCPFFFHSFFLKDLFILLKESFYTPVKTGGQRERESPQADSLLSVSPPRGWMPGSRDPDLSLNQEQTAYRLSHAGAPLCLFFYLHLQIVPACHFLSLSFSTSWDHRFFSINSCSAC